MFHKHYTTLDVHMCLRMYMYIICMSRHLKFGEISKNKLEALFFTMSSFFYLSDKTF